MSGGNLWLVISIVLVGVVRECVCLRSLVIIDNLNTVNSHSQFIQDVQSVSKSMDMKSVSNQNLRIKHLEERLYDLVVVLCTSDESSQQISVESLLEYYDDGGNLIIIAEQSTSRMFRTLFHEMGLELTQVKGSFGGLLLDHYEHAHDDHTLLQLSNQVLYRGLAMTNTIYQNHQQFNLLSAGPYAYSSSDSSAIGSKLALVSAVQGNNNARAVLSAGIDMFSNQLYHLSNGTNREYVKQHIIQYASQESNVLRVTHAHHYHTNDSHQHQPTEYKIKDYITYEIQIEKKENEEWVPYLTNDLQLEFVMLDPYVRIGLSPIGEREEFRGWYRASFRAPDQHGVFHFKVNYLRPLFTFITHQDKIPVRPFKHNEYERFLFCAYPYYFSVGAVVVGFMTFLFLFMYSGERVNKEKKEQ